MPPLRLTPFEEYMLLDSHPAYPMSCFLCLRLRGSFDIDLFSESVRQSLKKHPLFRSYVIETSPGIFCWQEHDAPLEIRRVTLGPETLFPAAEGIDLLHEPALKISFDTRSNGQTNLFFEIHHSASDAAGLLRFLTDMILEYAVQKGFIDPSLLPEPVDLSLLQHRGKYGLTFRKFLRILPRQLWGLQRAWTFLLRHIVPLVPTKPDLSRKKPSAAFPVILARQLNDEETKTVQLIAKREKVTMNDLLLRAMFLAMQDWRTKNNIAEQRGFLRIAVPTNLRRHEDRLMPAANIVSMIFLDRKQKQIHNGVPFLRGIHREMQHVKRCNLGLALIHGLTIYRTIFGSFTNMINQDRCWTTATVSNLGLLFNETPLPNRDGHILLDQDLELLAIDMVPPIRPQSVLGLCVFNYAGRMTINMQYDSETLDRSQAALLFERFINYLLEC